MSTSLLEVEDLTIRYRTNSGNITAVSDATFTVQESNYFGLVGESGCGKSTIAKAIIGGLDENGYIESGTIRYKGTEIQTLSDEERNERFGWEEIAHIPQGSMNSLDPIERISDQAVEIAKTHTNLSQDEALDRFREMFSTVGLSKDRITDYPHQFSGGMQQRAIIALALFLQPSLIVADEPTTALDVVMQDQIFKYLDQTRASFDTSMLLITHDISLVFESCNQMAMMHAGQIAESGTTYDIFDSPRHPYSILLQRAFPDIRYPNQKLGTIDGHPPKNYGNVTECTFADRCPWAVDDCRASAPDLQLVGTDRNEENPTSHQAACIRAEEVYELYDELEVSSQ